MIFIFFHYENDISMKQFFFFLNKQEKYNIKNKLKSYFVAQLRTEWCCCPGSLLWCRFDAWSWNFHTPWVLPQTGARARAHTHTHPDSVLFPSLDGGHMGASFVIKL